MGNAPKEVAILGEVGGEERRRKASKVQLAIIA